MGLSGDFEGIMDLEGMVIFGVDNVPVDRGGMGTFDGVSNLEIGNIPVDLGGIVIFGVNVIGFIKLPSLSII